MKTIEQMIDDVLVREGGYVNHPADRGGATNFGITLATLSKYLGQAATLADIQSLSLEVAREIYQRNFYFSPGLHTLPDTIQPFVFDSAVNHGPRTAIRFLQSVCNQAGYQPALSEDGAIGPNTRRGIAWAIEAMGDVFLQAIVEERKNFYLIIVAARPSQEVFLNGWMNRIKEFEQEVA